ncbi:MAG: hypothetical protein J6L62_07000 [Clostridia bacterium]|nr:hypothetical protein [Clostridia bacterium]
MKKTISVLLALVLALCCMPVTFATDEEARLYTVYADGMLFQQKEEAILAGTAKAGSIITVSLSDENNNVIETEESVTKADGKFTVSFDSPEGAFKEYTVTVEENGEEFAKLSDVVFGELWLASGQSNMQYPLSQAKGGYDDWMNGKKHSKWLRVLMVPPYINSYSKIGYVPDEPMKDIEGAEWISGQDEMVYNMSAVAFYFADEMLEELDMPVGILNASLGGSTIASWISREKADSDPEFKEMLYDCGAYKESKDWTPDDQNVYTDIGANYNHKIEALKNFRPVGMIWYQGEGDIGHSEEYYSKAMDVMQDLYTDVFCYEDGYFPLIYTNLAEYFYNDDGMVLPDRNIAFSEIQAERPESRATFGIYDLPITFLPGVGVIHPENKKEIGERMALCAKGMVYGKFETHTSATVESTESESGSLYIKFKNVGDGLVQTGDKLYGFAVCGADGIYLEAKAEITSTDTVRVWNDRIENPVSATYAYCMGNGRSNLAASYEGENPLPVGIFVTDKTVGTHYWTDKQWADCEIEGVWHTMSDTNSNYYPSWVSETAQLSRSSEAPYSGNYCMKILTDEKNFSVKPNLTYKEGIKTENFWDTDTDYSDYDTMTFCVRNNGENDVTLDEVRFCKNSSMWHAPAIMGTTDPSTVIPADGEWHVVTLDLNRLYLHSNEGGVAFANEKIKVVRDIEIRFSAEKGSKTDLSFDSVEFTASDEKVKPQFDSEFANADGLFETLCVIVTRFLGLFAKIFN